MKIQCNPDSLIAILGGRDTPYCKATRELKNWQNADLIQEAADACVTDLALAPETIDYLVAGAVLHNPDIPDPARTAVLRSRLLPDTLYSETVSSNCISAMTAIVSAANAIHSARSRGLGPRLALVGGGDSMTNVPLLFGRKEERYFRSLGAKKSGLAMAIALLKRPRFPKPRTPSPKEPTTGKLMGQHCELMVQDPRFGIGRDAQDLWAVESHHKASSASATEFTSRFVTPLGGLTSHSLPRSETSLEMIADYPAIFDRSGSGTITKAHTGPFTDGASMLAVADPQRAKELGLSIGSYLFDWEYAAMSSKHGLLMAPGLAVPRLLKRHGLTFDDFDTIEVHEAFAGQMLCNISAWENGWLEDPIGPLPLERVNRFGGSIAYGHPFAATCGRICNFLNYGLADLAQSLGRPTLGLGSACAAGSKAYAWIQIAYPKD
jgi:acetyl-CoA acetyltransferase family protein